MVSKEFIRQLEGYGLTTATILYRMPDHPALLQLRLAGIRPGTEIPRTLEFLDFWKRELEGPLPFGHGGPFPAHQALPSSRP